MIAGLILAAGAATRFGAIKQLAELDGRPLIEHPVLAMEAAGVDRVVVVLGAHADTIRGAADLLTSELVWCADWEEGQAASLRAGVDAVAEEADAVVITLGDQPRITPEVIGRFVVLGVRHGAASRARAVYDGRPGHPVLLGSAYFAEMRALRGDAGARDLLTRVGAHEIECGHLCRADDVDTPDQLEALRR